MAVLAGFHSCADFSGSGRGTPDLLDGALRELLLDDHQAQGSSNDPAAMQFMRQYIRDFNEFKSSSSSADELKKKMLAKYPKLALETLLDGAAGRAFPAK